MVSVESWCSVLSEILDDTGWTVDVEDPKMSIFHRTSPFETGTLLRFTFTMFLQDLPDESQFLIVRPEVRAQLRAEGEEDPFTDFLDGEMLEVIAPGDVIVQSARNHGVMRLIRGVFGDFNSGLLPSGEDERTGLFRSVHMRNYPAHGELSIIMVPRDKLTISSVAHYLRISAGCYQMSYVMHLPGECSMLWSACMSVVAPFNLNVIHRLERTLSRPGLPRWREADQHFYVVLTLGGCKRGPPLLPASENDATIKLNNIADGDVAFWKHQESGVVAPFAEYLRLFLENIFPAHAYCVYGSLDGRQLVPYQCVMKRAEWEFINPDFTRAVLTHKTAYRHAYGGSTAPTLKDTSEARFQRVVVQPGCDGDKESAPFVVRNTFIEVDEEDGAACELQRDPRRIKTIAPANLS